MSNAIKLIQKLPPKLTPQVIAVDGFGGSGKSTIASKLSGYLPNSTIVAMDDHINKGHLNDSSWEFTFNRDSMKAKVLSVSDAPNTAYIIVEGISSTHPSLAELYDFTIWVDTPIDVAKSRGQLRDTGNGNKGKWDLWAENDLKYFKKYQPKDSADIVIVNADNSFLTCL